MQLGRIIGHATSTIKHASLQGWRLAVVQPLNATRDAEGDPLLAIDPLNAGQDQVVVLNSDGKFARELIGNDKTPARWVICATVDE